MLEKHYQHNNCEKKWQYYWGRQELYKWDENAHRDETFVIDTPPPTVSGSLHMGHIYSYTQADFIARFQRMSGKTVCYPIGFDDNGLPTERLVEKDKGIKAYQIGRAEFIAICKQVVQSYESEFKSLFQSIALSFDWSQEYQTISDISTKISQMSFIDLYRKKLAYRSYTPTFWDPVDQTAIAQAEIEDKEQHGIMSEIRFGSINGIDVVIASTRPELLPACVALFYNPDDDRYQHLANCLISVPIYGQQVPILSDKYVDPQKGTGIVMCCTFGDIQDVRWWQQYNLDLKQCINKSGQMENAGILDGLKVKAAREKILELLQVQGLVLNQVELLRPVKCAERSGATLEIIATNQWYVSVMNQKDKLLEQSAKCQWHPPYMKVRLDNWIKGLNQDWCISRQRFFGVPFPVWYSKRPGEEGKILLPEIDQLPVNPIVDLPKGYLASEVTPEFDIMDTWATSSLTPQLVSRGINEELTLDLQRHQKLFPVDLRPQGHEIIRTWAFTTIVKALYHQNSIPWKNLMISGWCLSSDKTKMSKSKGNTITPTKLIEEKGADVVRYWAAHSKLGADIYYSEDAFKDGQKLVNKLWNIAKFCSLHLPKLTVSTTTVKQDIISGLIYEPADLWLLAELYQTIEIATEFFKEFEYCEAKTKIELFFWTYCDHYIELAKSRLYNDQNRKGQFSGIVTIYHSLETILKLFAPFTPHITEEIYQTLYANKINSIHSRGTWPKLEHYQADSNALNIGRAIVTLLELVRKSKSNANISIAKTVPEIKIQTTIDSQYLSDLKNAINTEKMTVLNNIESDEYISECGNHKVCIIYQR
jgi:valyl-tRNA synthetase